MTRTKHITTALTALSAAAILAGPANAQAATVKVSSPTTKTVKAGAKATATITTAGGASTCKLQVAKTSKTVKLQGATKVRFSFKVAKKAKPGRYAVKVSCASAKGSYKLRIAKPSKGKAGKAKTLVSGKITAKATGRPAIKPTAPTAPVAPAQPATPKTYTADSPEVTQTWERYYKANYDQVFTTSGECTQLTYEKRRDIVERTVKTQIATWMNAGSPAGGFQQLDWTAKNWAANAKIGGFTVDQTPAPNSIVVRPAFDDAGPGHVAYVTSVGTTSIHVVEMNAAGGKGVTTERDIENGDIAALGLQFIH